MPPCNGSVNVGIGGVIIPVSGNGTFVVGVNIPVGTQTVTLDATADTLISNLDVLSN